MKKILMVCLGNICRSPLAEGILRSKLTSDSFKIDSAGTAGHHVGELPDKRSVEVAHKYGIDITKQRSRQFKKADFKEFDVIYAMDQQNYDNIISMTINQDDIQKVKMILNELQPDANKNVPDPYYGGNQGFENVYKMLDEACLIIASKLKN
ncbi:low molecular weight phosphotyrosine protein phosphatase [Tenacibaculum pacificus]|uniref:low molecular weight protein-tyrosine-phosphatase n=1 Tax=Tenacibaculum TaxID=104267 RepID=UPI0022F3FD3E|nr:low molecular weight protein-tyrosine-phosphatase [Tenacibaculum pacificus]WBX74515.1 low molecular weight phosphotyrosine protein phosphatase [Tenacibaculum pacificus]